ncbi:hypothetical protein LOAG_18988, partial [Loa loa]
DIIIKSAQPAKQKLEDLLDEVKTINLTPPDQHLRKNKRLTLCVGILGSINEKWLEYIQKQRNAQKRKEEDKYTDMVHDNKGLLNLNLINNGQKATVTLDMYKDEYELAIQCLQQSKINIEAFQQKEPPPKCLSRQ